MKKPSAVTKALRNLTVEQLQVLIDQYDSWSGSLHPDSREEYLAEFDDLRNALNKETC